MSGTLATIEYVGSGAGNSGSDSGTEILSGGVQEVGYDSATGTVSDITIDSGGAQAVGVLSGSGYATGTTIDGGVQSVGVEGSGSATSTTISGGEQYVGAEGGGVGSALDTTIEYGARQFVGYDFGSGEASSTTIDQGGLQQVGYLYGTGTAIDTTIDGGEQNVGVGSAGATGVGTAISTSIGSAGYQEVGLFGSGSGTAIGTTIFNGGEQDVGVQLGSGSALDTTIDGGIQVVGDYGGAGTATSTTIENGGEQVVNAGGTADDDIIFSGGVADIHSDGVANATVIDGGTLQLASGAVIGSGGIAFAADSNWGTLDLTGEGSGLTFAPVISGFAGTGGAAGSSDVIDVTGTGAAGDHVVWTQNGGSGTLQVEDAGNNVLETLTLAGTYDQNHFVLTESASVDQIAYRSFLSSTEYVGSGSSTSGSDSGTTIVQGGSQHVGYDYGTGTATSTTISGGVQFVGDEYGTGAAVSTIIDSGAQYVGYWMSANGTATSTIIENGGAQYVGYDFGTGTAASTTIDRGGVQLLGEGGTGSATNTIIYSGATQYVGESLGTGSATDTTICGGVQFVGAILGTGTATNTTIDSGGVQYVGQEGTGTAAGTTISGGVQFVGQGGTGTATSTTIEKGGEQFVGDGSGGVGTATSTTIYSGGSQFVSSGGTADDDLIYSGGVADIHSGGVANATVIDGGTLQLAAGAVIASGGIAFAADANWGTLDLTSEDSGLTFAPVISGFAGTGGAADSSDIFLVDGSGQAGDHVVWTQNGATGTLQVEDAGNNVLETLTLAGTYDQNNFVLTDPASVDQIAYDSSPPCFCRGVRILTDQGEVPVENLSVGDRVVTASGETKLIRWIGRRSLDCTRHPDPRSVWPVCVAAGAFGDQRPLRNLWLSPGHSIASEGALMPIYVLQNGKTVAQVERSRVEYWHIELDAHDVVFAEGLPAESYLDQGNRTAFVNGGAFVEAHPDFKPKHWAETCLPLVFDGPEVGRTRARLFERLSDFGLEITAEHDLHIMADGERIDPVELGAMRFAFSLPANRADIRLVSRTFVPVHVCEGNSDIRSLGVCVGRLQIDGETIALDDEALDWVGWHEAEPGRRWTRGSASLPPRTRLVLIDLAGRGYYWRERKSGVAALFA